MMPSTCSFAMADSTMDCCMGRPLSSGSGRKPEKWNHFASSLRASCRSRHQLQVSAEQGVSRSRRTSRPASGNWWRTQGGMTELPPDTDSHASANASGQPVRAASAVTSRAWVRHALSTSRESMASRASASDGRGDLRKCWNTLSNPAPLSAVVSQCQAVSRSAGVSRNFSS